jgi:putative membrane protein
MSKTVTMMGVLALAATTALAQSTTTTSGQASGTSGQSSSDGQGVSGQSGTTEHTGHGMKPADEGTKSKGSTSANGSLSASDKQFIQKAATGGMAEVELGKLAQEKASSPEVKAFGQMMVDDHSKANDELKTLASEKGITLPTDAGAAHKAKISKLEGLSGEQFDRAYMQEMLKDHKKDVADFKRTAKSSKDQDLKDWAAKKVPTLEQHLQHAQMASNMGHTSATGTTSGTSTSGSDSTTSGSDSSSSTSGSKSKSKDKSKDKGGSDSPSTPSRK